MITTFYVYALVNSLTGDPFYYGKGKGQRRFKHIIDALNPQYPHRSVHRKIQSIIKKGGRVTYAVTPCATEQHAFNLEQYMISKWGRLDIKTGILHNLTDGGEGSANVSIITKQRRLHAHLGVKRSNTARKNMSIAQLQHAETLRKLFNGKGCSPETSLKHSLARSGVPWSAKAKNVIRRKPTARAVLIFNKDTNEFIGEWESISLCARELNLDVSALARVCKGSPNKYTKQYKGKFKDI